MKKILIIGAGAIGSAIGHLFKNKNDLKIEFWDIDKKKVPKMKPLEETTPKAEIIFLCVPSWSARKAAQGIANLLTPKTIIVSISKGLEEKTAKTMNEVLEEVLPPNQNIALLMGPMLAKELQSHLMGAAAAASKNKSAFNELNNLFKDTNLRLEYSCDLKGVALAGVLKNIYAIGLGIADGLKLGNNFKGWYVKNALSEMAAIINRLGGRAETAHGLAGIGDFIATGFSHHSTNYSFGFEFAKKGKSNLKSEGFVSLPSLIKLLGKDLKRFTLLNALAEIIIKKRKPLERGRLEGTA